MSEKVRRLAVLTTLLAFAVVPVAEARVMHGSDAAPGEYPWTVALVFPGEDPQYGQFCGGSLIAPDKVLTAAHCTMGSRASEIDVFAGDHDLGDEDPGERYDVTRIHLPSDAEVDPDTNDVPRRDLAVLDLATPVAGAAGMAIAPVAASWDEDTELEVMGWGRWADPFSAYPNLLQHATLDRVSDADCLGAYGPADFHPSDMVCALRVSGSKVIDSCGGDSGGPLTTVGSDPKDPADWRLAGVVSFGSAGCDDPDVPGVYARVAAPALHAFVEAFRDGDEAGDPPAQLERTGGAPVLSGTPKVGEQLTCGAGTTTWTATPTELSPRIRAWDAWYQDYATVAVGPTYTLSASDEGDRFVCEVHARRDGVGGYGVARSSLSASVARGTTTTTTTSPVAPPPTTPPPAPPAAPVAPAPPPADPQPFVPEPRGDETAPRTTAVSRRCAARRCTLTIRASDLGPVVSGVAALDVTLVTRFRCVRGGRRRTCISQRTLTASRLAAGLFRARTPKLRRRALHRVEVFATDRAGNEEPGARVYAFRL